MSIYSSTFTEYFLTDFSVYKQCEECRININVSTVSVEVIHVGPSLFDPRALVRPICTFGDNFCTFGDNFLAPRNNSYMYLPTPFPTQKHCISFIPKTLCQTAGLQAHDSTLRSQNAPSQLNQTLLNICFI